MPVFPPPHAAATRRTPCSPPVTVDLENVSQVVSGTESDPSFSKFRVDSKVATSFFRRGSATAAAAATYNMAGFLHKKGGSKGGRRNWTYVRFWFCLPVHAARVGCVGGVRVEAAPVHRRCL